MRSHQAPGAWRRGAGWALVQTQSPPLSPRDALEGQRAVCERGAQTCARSAPWCGPGRGWALAVFFLLWNKSLTPSGGAKNLAGTVQSLTARAQGRLARLLLQ